MKKIILLRANKTKFGGAEVYLNRLSNELNKNNIKHEIRNSPFPKFLPSWIKVVLFNLFICFKKKNNEFYFSLDRVYCSDVYRAGDGVHKTFLRIERKTKINPLHMVYLFLEKRIFLKSKKIIAISNMVKKNIIDEYKINPNKIKVVYNGIKIKKINYEESFNKLKKEFDLKNEIKFLYVGSGFKRKGVKEFLEILSKIKNKNFKAFVIGKEKDINYYIELSKKLNINGKVYFTGPRTDVSDFYAISDIFLFPTKYEPFGNVIIEAMNFNNVVITTKNCGGGEILDKDYIMENSNDYSIVKKINNLLENQEKIEDIKKRNFEIVKNFTIEKNMQETMEVINEVIS